MSDYVVVMRLLWAVFLSGLIGLEREVTGRAAGLRTHVLVGVGSTLIMLTAIYLMETYRAVSIDPGRVAAQVVSGIGFLGAGAILQTRDSVRGLTTAASIWATAGIGLAIGAGFHVGAVATTAIMLIVLYFFSYMERRIVRSKSTNGHGSEQP